MAKQLVILGALAVGLFASQSTLAEVSPQALPTDSRMVVMKYNPAQIFSILTAPSYMTHIELEPGEKLTIAPALGDTIQWEVETDSNHVFLKPDAANIRTNMSLVTNKRTYQFNLVASPEGGVYYQYVQFKYPDNSLKKLRQSVEVESESLRVQSQTNMQVVDPTAFNSNYKITGSGKFKPEFVQDDGKFTYIKLAADLKELPIVYVKENGAYSQVNYTPKPKNNFITVTRTADEFVLVLDKEEVLISKKKSGFWQ